MPLEMQGLYQLLIEIIVKIVDLIKENGKLVAL